MKNIKTFSRLCDFDGLAVDMFGEDGAEEAADYYGLGKAMRATARYLFKKKREAKKFREDILAFRK